MIAKDVYCKKMNRDGKAGLKKTGLKEKMKSPVKNRIKHATIFPAVSTRYPR